MNVVYPAGYLLILDFGISDPAELFVIRCQFWHIWCAVQHLNLKRSKQYHVSWLPAPFSYRNRNFFHITSCLHLIFNKVSLQLAINRVKPQSHFGLFIAFYIWEDSSALTGEPDLNSETTHTSGKCEEAMQIWTQGCYIRAYSSHLVLEVTWAHQANASNAKATALKPNSAAYFRANTWNTARF